MKQVSFRLGSKLWNELAEMSRETKLSKTALLRMALDNLIKEKKTHKDKEL